MKCLTGYLPHLSHLSRLSCYLIFLTELTQDLEDDMHRNNFNMAVSEFEFKSSFEIEMDIFNLLESWIYDTSSANVLGFCTQTCLLAILRQVS